MTSDNDFIVIFDGREGINVHLTARYLHNVLNLKLSAPQKSDFSSSTIFQNALRSQPYVELPYLLGHSLNAV